MEARAESRELSGLKEGAKDILVAGRVIDKSGKAITFLTQDDSHLFYMTSSRFSAHHLTQIKLHPNLANHSGAQMQKIRKDEKLFTN